MNELKEDIKRGLHKHKHELIKIAALEMILSNIQLMEKMSIYDKRENVTGDISIVIYKNSNNIDVLCNYANSFYTVPKEDFISLITNLKEELKQC